MKKQLVLKFFLYIVLIIIVSTLLLLLVNYAQKKQRDVERLNNIASIRLALESYFFHHQSYPITQQDTILGSQGAKVLCNTDIGIQNTGEDCDKIFMNNIAKDPLSENEFRYIYNSNGDSYNINFFLERNDSGLSEGNHQATPEGIK